MKEKKTSARGITIIVLIITIIVMLILLGITVNTVMNGKLFEKADEAVDKTNNKVAQQQTRVDELTGTLTEIDSKQKLQEEVRRLREIIKENQITKTGEIQEILKTESEYDRILRVDDGELTYKISTDITENEKTCLEEMGVPVSKIDEQNLICAQNPTIYYIADETNIEKYSAENIGTLIDFRTLVNSNTFNYAEARLIEDIYLNCNETNQWLPIGTSTYKFTKVFDGQMHTISGIYINDTTEDYVGLFGYVRNGTIQNLGIVEGSITGNNYVAGLVGQYSGTGTIFRCFNKIDIKGNNNISGICGYLFEADDLAISECYNKGIITCLGSSVGGICGGDNGWGESLYNCYNMGKIVGGRQAGGIYGHDGVQYIYNCYNTGNITSTYCGGSIHGMNYRTDLRNCFGLSGTFGSVSSYNYGSYGAKVTNCLMKSEDEMKSAEFVTILNTLTETVKDTTTGEESIVSTTQDVWVQDTTGINDGYPILKWQLENE